MAVRPRNRIMKSETLRDIECPRCHRINFAWDASAHCKECHWTIRPIEIAEPYGYDVLIEVQRTGSLLTETQERHYKGNETTARRRAKSIPMFLRVLAVIPLSQESWINAYGEGRM